jgi:hypothetical protein
MPFSLPVHLQLRKSYMLLQENGLACGVRPHLGFTAPTLRAFRRGGAPPVWGTRKRRKGVTERILIGAA